MDVKKVLFVVLLTGAIGVTTALAANGFRAESGRERLFSTDVGRHQGFELTDEQKAGMEAKMKEHLSQALEEGIITQEQYDERIAAIENTELPPRGMERPGFKGEYERDRANARGEMRHPMREGERPEPTDEQKAERDVKMKEHLSQALEEGKITQEQYDAMIEAPPMEGGFPHGRGKVRNGVDKPEALVQQ